MGLPKPGKGYTSGERFSDDVLKIELCGPSRSHFSVVDVPGLFQSIFPSRIFFIFIILPQSFGFANIRSRAPGATVHQTEGDAEVVENLAKRYIQDSRTIILWVLNVAGNNDYSF